MGVEDTVQAIKVKLQLENPKDFQDQMTRAWTMGNAVRQENLAKDSSELTGFFKFYNDVRNRFRGIPGDDVSGNTKMGLKMTGEASQTSSKIADDIMKIMKTGIGIVEDIHSRIKQASPLLQSVESLFNLAVQLFFMPLGNKLATVMLPAIMELVDGVMAMWEEIDGMDLGEMLTTMIDYGVNLLSDYFHNLGDSLEKQGGLLGSIGSILKGVGDFIESDLEGVLYLVLDTLKFIMSNLGTLLLTFLEFKIASISLQLAQISATIWSSNAITALTAGLVTFGAAEGVANEALLFSGTTSKIMGLNAATGMYVGATEGGRSVTVAEGGEGEFILPENRLSSILDSVSDRMVDTAQTKPTTETKATEPQVINNYYNTFNGYTDNDILEIVRSEVSDQISYAKLRGGL